MTDTASRNLYNIVLIRWTRKMFDMELSRFRGHVTTLLHSSLFRSNIHIYLQLFGISRILMLILLSGEKITKTTKTPSRKPSVLSYASSIKHRSA